MIIKLEGGQFDGMMYEIKPFNGFAIPVGLWFDIPNIDHHTDEEEITYNSVQYQYCGLKKGKRRSPEHDIYTYKCIGEICDFYTQPGMQDIITNVQKNPKPKLQLLSIDTETTGPNLLKDDTLFAISCCSLEIRETWKTNKFQYKDYLFRFRVDPYTRQLIDKPRDQYRSIDRANFVASRSELSELIESAERIVMHNSKFDIRALKKFGLHSESLELIRSKLDDTLLASHVCDSSESHKLKDLSEKYLGILKDDEDNLKEITKVARRQVTAKTLDKPWNIHPDIIEADYWIPGQLWENDKSLETYAIRDARRTLDLWLMYESVLEEESLWKQYHDELDLSFIVSEMEEKGIRLNENSLSSLISKYKDETEEHRKYLSKRMESIACNELYNNPNSPKQLKDILYNHLQLPTGKSTKTGEPSTDKETIKTLLAYCINNNIETSTIKFLETHLDYKLKGTAVNYLSQYQNLAVEEKETISITINKKIEKKKKNLKNLKDAIKEENKKDPAKAAIELLREKVEILKGFSLPEKLRKLETKYLDKSTYRCLILQTNFNQTGTDTTRFSSSNPNLQNVGKADPRDKNKINLRQVFIPREGYTFFAFDYSQLELRIFAYVAQEKSMQRWFRDNKDIHQETGNLVFGDPKNEDEAAKFRRIGKDLNFMKIYGGGLNKATQMTGSEEAAKRLLDSYNETFPGVKYFMNEVTKEVRVNGSIVTLYGYKLMVPKDKAYIGTNYIVQGTAGNLLKKSMLDCNKWIHYNGDPKECYMVLTIHDELLFEIRNDCFVKYVPKIKELMENNEIKVAGKELITPVDTSMCPNNWGSKIEL